MLKISEIVTNQIITEAKQREDEHISSGKLSASMLGNPTQWQVLKWLGVPPREHSNYTYCKFERGRNVENFIIEKLQSAGVELISQELVEYKNVAGLIDIYLPETNEIIEIKSTANSAFRYIVKDGLAKENHILQTCLYAKAKGAERFSIAYVATDDYRVCQFDFRTADHLGKIEKIIADFNGYIKRKEIPEFKALSKWQEMEKYNDYPEWKKMTKNELKQKAKQLYVN